MDTIDHITGRTFHRRLGETENKFSYAVDFLLLTAEGSAKGPWPFRRNARALVSLWDKDHGGQPKKGSGADWAREVLVTHGLAEVSSGRIDLLAQPRVLGSVFNPVSFWLAYDAEGQLRVVIAEVTNTFGDRHSYLCHRADLGVIEPSDTLTAKKVFHVSPFQSIAGDYRFRFDISSSRIAIDILHTNGSEGVHATLAGPRRALTGQALWRMIATRGFGGLRVLGLIHWQAFKLWRKGARYKNRPTPPSYDVS